MANPKVEVQLAVSGLAGYKRDMTSAMNQTKKMGKVTKVTFGGIAKTIASGVAIVGTAAVGVGTAITTMAIKAGEFESVSDAFKTMTTGIGLEGDKLVKEVKTAVSGTVTELDVMKNFVTANTLIGEEALGEQGKNFVRMATIAKKSARATGQDVDYMMESIVKGIGKSSKVWLDNTGIVIDVIAAQNIYAKSLGKTRGELTETEKKIATTTAFLAKAEEQYKDVKVSAGGIASAWNRVKVVFSEVTTEIGLAFIPIVKPLLNTLSGLVQRGIDLVATFREGGFNDFFEGSEIFQQIIRSVNILRSGIKEFMQGFGQRFKELFPLIKDSIGELGNAIGDMFGVANKDGKDFVSMMKEWGPIIAELVVDFILGATTFITIFVKLHTKIIAVAAAIRGKTMMIIGWWRKFEAKIARVRNGIIQVKHQFIYFGHKVAGVIWRAIAKIKSLIAWIKAIPGANVAINVFKKVAGGEYGGIIQGYQHGGVIPGSSLTGDRTTVRANSGEMILTRGQQGALFNMIKNLATKPNVNFNAPISFGGERSQMQQENMFSNLLLKSV